MRPSRGTVSDSSWSEKPDFCVTFVVFKLKKKDVCYKKYLGPDWKPKFSGAPTLIANHRSWCDIGVGVGHFCACFVAADRVR